jgi:hypothetical protein
MKLNDPRLPLIELMAHDENWELKPHWNWCVGRDDDDWDVIYAYDPPPPLRERAVRPSLSANLRPD